MSLQLQTAQDVKTFIWNEYDANDDLIYPNVDNWTELLEEAIAKDSYDKFTKDEVLSILFGLNHRNRIVNGLWESMFERGVTQNLLLRLSVLDAE